MFFMQPIPIQSNEGHPLFRIQLGGGLTGSILCIVYFNAFAFNHYEASVYAFDLCDQLFLGYWPSLGLLDIQLARSCPALMGRLAWGEGVGCLRFPKRRRWP